MRQNMQMRLYLLTDVMRATNFPGNPPCTSGSATIAIKPANMMQAIGFAARQEWRSRASTANETSSRQSLTLGADFEGSRDATVFPVESDKESAAATDKGNFTCLDETAKEKSLLLIIAFLKLQLNCQCSGPLGWIQLRTRVHPQLLCLLCYAPGNERQFSRRKSAGC
jgi:hypothetical protein